MTRQHSSGHTLHVSESRKSHWQCNVARSLLGTFASSSRALLSACDLLHILGPHDTTWQAALIIYAFSTKTHVHTFVVVVADPGAWRKW